MKISFELNLNIDDRIVNFYKHVSSACTKKRVFGFVTGISFVSSLGIYAANITKPNTFSSGSVILSSHMNQNFDTLFNEINLKEFRLNVIEANGWLTNANINAAAAVAVSKLAAGTDGQVLKTNGVTPTWTTVPAVHVTNVAVQSIPNTTFTAITFDSEYFDTDTMHSTAVNTTRLTATTAGIYQITGQMNYAANAAGFRIAAIVLNGVTYLANTQLPASGASGTGLHASSLYRLNVNDYVELQAYQSSGAALNTVAGYATSLSMVKVAD